MYVNVRHSFILSRTCTYNWLRGHTSWASSRIEVKIKSIHKNFWSLVLNFTTPRCILLFLNSKTYIVHIINCERSRSVNFPLYMYLSNKYKDQKGIFAYYDIYYWKWSNPFWLLAFAPHVFRRICSSTRV